MGPRICGQVFIRPFIPVAMLDLCDLELDGVWIPVGSEAVDDRTSWIAEREQLGHFVERFSGGIVARVAYVLVRPEILLMLGEVEMRVTSRDHQREHREIEFAISALPLLEQHGMNMPFKVVDRNQRFVEREGQSLGKADADK